MARGVFSLVVPVFDVAPYLPDFLASLEHQHFPCEDLEIIFVNDGSTDGSREIVTRWAEGRGSHAAVVDKANGGLASARNLGLDHCHHEWVTFCDPDDVLAPDYFARVHAFMTDHPSASMYATRILMLWENTGEVSDSHPLRRKFDAGSRVVDLDRTPDAVHMSVATGFLRRDRLEHLGLRFDESLRPNFEDGALVTRYLLNAPAPTIGYVADAHYHYRRRADSSGLIVSSRLQPEKYTVVPSRGYLEVLRYSVRHVGTVPLWLQNLVLYELFWYFRDHRRGTSFARSLPAEVQQEFHTLVATIMKHIRPEAVQAFDVRPVPRDVRRALLLGYKDTCHRPTEVVLDEVDRRQGLARLRYCFSGPQPAERILAGDETDGHPHSKTVDHVYFGRTLFRERIHWVPARGTLRVEIDGHPVPLSVGEPAPPRYTRRPAEIRDGLAPVRRARRQRARRRFRAAWVLVDHPARAGDNAEHLYRYLAAHHPRTNTWFALRRDSEDWARLRAEGFRLVDVGSRSWASALRGADHLVASHLEPEVLRAARAARQDDRALRFTFLQHGPRGHEPPHVVNGKPIDLLVTATRTDYHALAQDGSAYAFTTKEVRLTGLPRHDVLLRLARERKGQPRTALLAPGLAEPWPGERWTQLLRSHRLRELCCRHGATVTVLVPPEAAAGAPKDGLADHVRLVACEAPGHLESLATCALLVTEDTSLAVDAAYLGRPVVHARIDGPAGTRLSPDGEAAVGPLVTDPASVLDEIARALERGGSTRPVDESGAHQDFAWRDGRCCERIVQEMIRLGGVTRANT